MSEIVYVTADDYANHLNIGFGFHYYTSMEQLIEYEGNVECVTMTMTEYNRLNGIEFDDIGLN